ncbi:ras-domain-containing protein [Sporormia fimetaria CBS 119925]|uniref:Ras-domain-containing protein n=1 Tax=Sporormia fimetaria CBS 119925 TaxID=1340428 RepID=A0A6A6VD00_9PLEO|nr:ras-domain-containing protein [Sporormia fimetaria CBS 119925]
MAEIQRITITICGDGGCGKSSITLRLVRSQWTHEYDPTIEDSYSVTRTIDGTNYLLMLTDTAGQEEYRGLWATSNLSSDAFLLVYDITNSDSLHVLDYYMEMISLEEEARIDSGRPPPVKMVVGNKCDLQVARQVKSSEGLEYAKKHGAGFMETSAREMVNVEETFGQLIRRVAENRRIAAGEVQGPDAVSKTAALPPLSEKEKEREKRQSGARGHKGGFWRKLKCW